MSSGDRGSLRDRIRVGLIFLIVLAMAYLVWPLREPERAWNDFAWIYVAGRAWWEGVSPYDFPRWAAIWVAVPVTFSSDPITQPYMYPPHWVAIAMPMALLSLEAATRLWDAINVLSLLATFWFMAKLLKSTANAILFLIVVAILNGAVRYALWESQMSFVPTLAVVIAFWAWEQKRTAVIAVCTFFAMLKPQIGTLPLAFLLLNGAHAGVSIGAGAVLLVSIASLLPAGLDNVPAQYADCVARHMAAEFNDLSKFSNVSALWPTASFTSVGPLLGAGWIAWLSYLRRRDRLDPIWFLSMVVAAVPAFMPLHVYDFVLYTPLVIAAYVIRPLAIAAVAILLVQVIGRVHLLERATGFHPIAPFLTLALALLCLFALNTARSAERVGATLGKAQPDRVPFGESS